jgi:hypothetical protein
VSDDEVHRVVEKLKESGEPTTSRAFSKAVWSTAMARAIAWAAGRDWRWRREADPLYDQAVEVVIKNRRASISLVQRHLRIGYNRAARCSRTWKRPDWSRPCRATATATSSCRPARARTTSKRRYQDEAKRFWLTRGRRQYKWYGKAAQRRQNHFDSV